MVFKVEIFVEIELPEESTKGHAFKFHLTNTEDVCMDPKLFYYKTHTWG